MSSLIERDLINATIKGNPISEKNISVKPTRNLFQCRVLDLLQDIIFGLFSSMVKEF